MARLQMAFPAYGGVLHFDAAEEGLDPDWLRAQPLLIDFRKGGERLKPAHNRPTRALKYHYQACDVPAWERERLPICHRAGAAVCRRHRHGLPSTSSLARGCASNSAGARWQPEQP
jgi:tRNA(Ile)-lysidine synthetase-like protein